MGSGRSGAGGGGGGGSVTLNLPTYSYGVTRSKKSDEDDVLKAVNRVIRRLSKDYLKDLFGSSMTRNVYEQLFNLSVHIFQNKSWSGIEEIYGISGGVGCLRKWAAAVIQRYGVEEPSTKVREIVRDAFESFLLQALDNNAVLYDSGTSDKIMKALKQKVFSSTSAYFLRALIWRMLERQDEPLRDDIQIHLKDKALVKADAIDGWFEHHFLHKSHGEKRITYQDLFLVIQENMPSFIKELKK